MYRASLICLDKEFVNEVNKIIFEFIWKGKDKALIGDIEDGGLKAPHLDSIIKAQRILCCKKLASDYRSSWKSILLHYLKPVGGKFVLSCNFDVKLLPIKLPTFYEECFKHFTECSVANHTISDKLETADIARIVLWNNKFVCINGKTVYNNRLVNKGIIRIGGLIAENNELITKCKLRELNVSPTGCISTCLSDGCPPSSMASIFKNLRVHWHCSF